MDMSQQSFTLPFFTHWQKESKMHIRHLVVMSLVAMLTLGLGAQQAQAISQTCALGFGTTPSGWTLQGVGGGVDGTVAPFISGSGLSTNCVIVTDTGPGVGALPTGFVPTTNAITGTLNGSRMTSPVFTANAGDKLDFFFMFATNDGDDSDIFSDYARASLIDPSTSLTVFDLFTARTGSNSQVVPGFGLPSFLPGLVLTPGVSTLQGDQFVLTDFGGTQYGPNRFNGGPGGSSEWEHAVFTFDASTAGSYQLEMTVANVGATDVASALFFASDSISIAVVVPEPSTWFLLATGLVGLLGYGWRRRQRAA